jgi:DNA polymerase-3 subunit beta
MRFTVSSAALSSKLQALARVINSKNALPILDCFLFQVKGNSIVLTASDSENVLKTTIETTEAEGEGEFAINNKTILDALKELPDQPLTFDIDASTLQMRIMYQNGSYDIIGQNAEAYPEFIPLDEQHTTITIPSAVLAAGIERSLFATAQDELRPQMNGIFFDLNEESLTLVASDGHKLVRDRLFSIKGQPASYILPKKPANILRNSLQKLEGDVTITFDERNSVIVYDSFTLTCRLIEGHYPNYNAVIPKDNPNRIILDRTAMLGALKRVIIFASAASNLVKFHFESGQLTMSSQDVDYSTSATEHIDCQYEGSSINIGFKGSAMIEILNNLKSDEVVLELADPSRAGLVTPSEQPKDEDVLILIMPMLLSD